VTEHWTPELQLHSKAGGCRLTLIGITYGNGPDLQAASNDLLTRLFDMAVGLRAGQFRPSGDLGPPDPQLITFLWEIGEIIGRGGNIRDCVFGVPTQRQPSD
jgi:hypothetical protein